MTKPIPLPGALRLAEVCEATWPPASQKALGAWTIREGRGGGNRVSAATEAWPVTDADLPVAEKAMRALGQVPLFQIREGDHKLDALLESHGYTVRDPVNLWAVATSRLTTTPIPRGTVYTMWPPLELVRDIWIDGNVGPPRLAVMERAKCEKTAISRAQRRLPGRRGLRRDPRWRGDDPCALREALDAAPGGRRHDDPGGGEMGPEPGGGGARAGGDARQSRCQSALCRSRDDPGGALPLPGASRRVGAGESLAPLGWNPPPGALRKAVLAVKAPVAPAVPYRTGFFAGRKHCIFAIETGASVTPG